MIGEKLNNYRITGLLGEGGMGIVYRAEHEVIGRGAAIKVMRRELAANAEAVARFINEARAANAIRHRHIIEIFDAGTLADGTPFLTMELLEGETLAARLDRLRRLPVPAVLDIAIQATSALVATHTRGIVHRDLKPDNIFLVPDDVDGSGEMVKILDFGIAKLHATLGGGLVRTQAGTLIGTPIYMSPEQCRGSDTIDHRTDVYSLGLIMYQCLNGALPFASDSPGDVFTFHLRDTAPRLRTLHAEIPEAVDAIVARTLAKDPVERFASAAELLAALKQTAKALPATPPSPTLTPSGTPRPTKLLTPAVTQTSTTLSSRAGETTVRRTRGAPGRRVLIGAIAAGAAGLVVLALALRPSGRSEAPASPAAPPPAPAVTEPAPEPPPAPRADAAIAAEPPPPATEPPAAATPTPPAERAKRSRPARSTAPAKPARSAPSPNWKRDVRKL